MSWGMFLVTAVSCGIFSLDTKRLPRYVTLIQKGSSYHLSLHFITITPRSFAVLGLYVGIGTEWEKLLATFNAWLELGKQLAKKNQGDQRKAQEGRRKRRGKKRAREGSRAPGEASLRDLRRRLVLTK